MFKIMEKLIVTLDNIDHGIHGLVESEDITYVGPNFNKFLGTETRRMVYENLDKAIIDNGGLESFLRRCTHNLNNLRTENMRYLVLPVDDFKKLIVKFFKSLYQNAPTEKIYGIYRAVLLDLKYAITNHDMFDVNTNPGAVALQTIKIENYDVFVSEHYSAVSAVSFSFDFLRLLAPEYLLPSIMTADDPVIDTIFMAGMERKLSRAAIFRTCNLMRRLAVDYLENKEDFTTMADSIKALNRDLRSMENKPHRFDAVRGSMDTLFKIHGKAGYYDTDYIELLEVIKSDSFNKSLVKEWIEQDIADCFLTRFAVGKDDLFVSSLMISSLISKKDEIFDMGVTYNDTPGL